MKYLLDKLLSTICAMVAIALLFPKMTDWEPTRAYGTAITMAVLAVWAIFIDKEPQ